MKAELLLARLDGVCERFSGQWLACCPAHDDKSPSLSVKETEDGCILIHCFAGCAPCDVLAAVDLELSDLFPEKLEPRKGSQPKWNSRDLLLVVRNEATLIGCTIGRLLDRGALSDSELHRVSLAVQRIHKVLEVASVH